MIWEGRLLLDLQRPQESLAVSREAEELEPGNAKLLRLMGYAYEAAGSPDEALACFVRATEQDPEHPVAWGERARLLDDSARFEEALECYDKRLAIAEDPVVQCNRANTLVSMERFAEALGEFEQVLRQTPDDAYAMSGRFTALLGLGDVRGATERRPRGTHLDRGDVVEQAIPLDEERWVVLRRVVPDGAPDWKLKDLEDHAQDLLEASRRALLANELAEDELGRFIQWGTGRVYFRDQAEKIVACEPYYLGGHPDRELRYEVTVTLVLIAGQCKTAWLTDLEAAPVRDCEWVAYAQGALESKRCVCRRAEGDPETKFSGWYIAHDLEELEALQRDTAERAQVRDLIRMENGLMRFLRILTVPPHCPVWFDGYAITSIKDPTGKECFAEDPRA